MRRHQLLKEAAETINYVNESPEKVLRVKRANKSLGTIRTEEYLTS